MHEDGSCVECRYVLPFVHVIVLVSTSFSRQFFYSFFDVMESDVFMCSSGQGVSLVWIWLFFGLDFILS